MVACWAMLVLLPCCATLHIEKGISGTEYHAEGLTDKQLGILRWLWNRTYVDDQGQGSWSGLPVDPSQLGFSNSARYPLAFAAYAVASASFEHIPAARTGPARLLRNIFARLIDHKVWAYWATKGTCGAPWSQVCSLSNQSMCDLAAKIYEKDPVCPDPLSRANVMLSGHVAQVGSLYEAFGDDVLSTKGWTLQAGNWSHHFTLPSLLGALSEQAHETAKMGGGITCEPGMVYPSCNSHVHNAYRLYDALHKKDDHRNLTRAWRDFLGNHTSSTRSEWIFNVLMRHWKDGSLARSIRGCGSHEGWVLSWLAAWEGGENLFQRGVDNFLKNKRWTYPKPGQAFFHDDCFDQTAASQVAKSWLATSWFVAMATRHSAARERAQDVYRFLEEHARIIFGEHGEAEQFFYAANGEDNGTTTLLTDSIMVTSNALRGMVEREGTLEELYGSASRLQGPSIVVDWPRVLVRHAVWHENMSLLRFIILGDADIVVDLNGRLLENVTLDGHVHPWQHCGQHACVSCSGARDLTFEVWFSPPEKLGATTIPKKHDDHPDLHV